MFYFCAVSRRWIPSTSTALHSCRRCCCCCCCCADVRLHLAFCCMRERVGRSACDRSLSLFREDVYRLKRCMLIAQPSLAFSLSLFPLCFFFCFTSRSSTHSFPLFFFFHFRFLFASCCTFNVVCCKIYYR